MRIYISGPITGTSNATERFLEAEERLSREMPEAEWINPERAGDELRAGTDTLEHKDFMHVSFAMLDLCDAIYLLNGWQRSRGACMEYGYAKAMGMAIMEEL